jgi:hypothetical protein
VVKNPGRHGGLPLRNKLHGLFQAHVIPLSAGIQNRSFWRNAPQLLAALGLEKTNWIPALKGMTVVGSFRRNDGKI